ncbi:hypothetical protein EV647_0507 [Kribbella sp. VKM Ac-2566]|nr:hypothetical protein EV647_0507 [Kribbella sp. VKM Ac-2566]
MTIRLIHVGLGRFGLDWERRRIPLVHEIERVACVDANVQSLERAQQLTGVAAEDCFTRLRDAMQPKETGRTSCIGPWMRASVGSRRRWSRRRGCPSTRNAELTR